MIKGYIVHTLLGLLVTATLPVSASIIVDTGESYGTQEFSGARSIMSIVTVGSSDVAISQFGTKGQLNVSGNVEFAIFDGLGGDLTPSYLSSSQAATTSGDQWWYSPVLSFTLLAGHSYQIGLISDNGSFGFDWNYGVPAVTGGGLTVESRNGNVTGSYASPLTQGCCGGVEQAIRISDTSNVASAPEPGTIALMGGALAGFGLLRRRLAQ